MQSILPVVLFGLGGILVGGAWSVRSQGGSKVAIVALLAFATLSVLAGVLWLWPR